jgi:hypothetical protein
MSQAQIMQAASAAGTAWKFLKRAEPGLSLPMPDEMDDAECRAWITC